MEMTVGQVAERSNVKVSALHFYEQKGLIQSWRNAGNQRRYDRSVLRRIAVIKTAQQLECRWRKLAKRCLICRWITHRHRKNGRQWRTYGGISLMNE